MTNPADIVTKTSEKCGGCVCCTTESKQAGKSNGSGSSSEYQEVYKKWRGQPVQPRYRPAPAKDTPRNRAAMSNESSYRAAFCSARPTTSKYTKVAGVTATKAGRSKSAAKNEEQPEKENSDKPPQPPIGPAVTEKAKRLKFTAIVEADESGNPLGQIVPFEEDPPPSKSEANQKVRPKPIGSQCKRCTGLLKQKKKQKSESAFVYPNLGNTMVTTAMADFICHGPASRVECCRPPVTTHFHEGPFDGQSINSTAYLPWQVQFPEKPPWCRRKEFKKPINGMFTRSLYKLDFPDPGIVDRTSAIRPNNKDDPIKHIDLLGECKDRGTTYRDNFKMWPLVRTDPINPQKLEYTPPTERMTCESIHRSHFKGQQTDRVLPQRMPSNHEVLKCNQPHNFMTTYRETFHECDKDAEGLLCTCCKQPLIPVKRKSEKSHVRNQSMGPIPQATACSSCGPGKTENEE